MILNQAQAEAVYSAMCALNNVASTRFAASFETLSGKSIRVAESSEGVSVALFAFQGNPSQQLEAIEDYPAQSDFAAAYGLQ
jgi:myo-inositol-hexaphosphate 3-phosphohydrolase